MGDNVTSYKVTNIDCFMEDQIVCESTDIFKYANVIYKQVWLQPVFDKSDRECLGKENYPINDVDNIVVRQSSCSK